MKRRHGDADEFEMSAAQIRNPRCSRSPIRESTGAHFGSRQHGKYDSSRRSSGGNGARLLPAQCSAIRDISPNRFRCLSARWSEPEARSIAMEKRTNSKDPFVTGFRFCGWAQPRARCGRDLSRYVRRCSQPAPPDGYAQRWPPVAECGIIFLSEMTLWRFDVKATRRHSP
jgi:hypothetical protein